jgi:hypothetical protein
MLKVGTAILMMVALIPAATSWAGPTCGTQPTPPATYAHVVWIWMENHSYEAIVGSPEAPYVNGLIADCGLATNYHNVTHPSLPNYIAATSGLTRRIVRRHFRSDCDPGGSCRTSADSLFSQATTWRAYEEAMPSNCLGQDANPYAVRHNPPPYFTSLAGCATNDVPYTELAADLQADTLPAFAFVTPDLCHDTHDCSIGTGDDWLAAELPKILASPAYQSGTTAVLITWDEGEGGRSHRCESNTRDVGCQVATVVVSPSTPAGTTSAQLFNHYGLLRTTEEMLGIPLLGEAARAASLRAPFNL